MVVLFLNACDSNDDDHPPGSFRADVSGAVTASLEGRALFVLSEADDPISEEFELVLIAGRDAIFLRNYRAVPPAEVTYEIVEDPLGVGAPEAFVGSYLHEVSEEATETQQFFADAGSLTITSSSAERVEGQFRFEGFAVPDADQGRVIVSGSFVAFLEEEDVP